MARPRRWLVLVLVLALGIWIVWRRDARGTRRESSGVPSSGASGAGPAAALAPDVLEPGAREAPTPRDPRAATTADGRNEPHSTTRLRVLEEGSRRPIVGARVKVYTDERRAEVETDARGACELSFPAAQAWLPFHVQKEGYVHVATQLERKDELEVELPRGATLFGRVLAADSGAPIASARLHVGHPRCQCPVTTVESDGSGRYELPCVPLHESYTVIGLSAAGFPRASRRFELRSDEARIEQDFRLERGLEITGRVVDFVTGAGVPGALVADFPADDAGRFRSWVACEQGTSELCVSVSAPGYCTLGARYDRKEVERGGPLELRLPRFVAVEGIVHDAAGNPLAGAHVGAEIDHERELAEPGNEPESARSEIPSDWILALEAPLAHGRADAAGKFRIAGLVPWHRFTSIWAGKEGYEIVEQRPESTGAPGTTLWLELVLAEEPEATTARIMGSVRLDGLQGSWRGSVTWKGPTREGQCALTDSGFHLEVEPGEVRFQVAIDGVAGALEGETFALELARGAFVDHDVELRLPPAPILGRVRFQDGAPVAGARVGASVALPGHGVVRLATDCDDAGCFRLDVPELGTPYRVEAARGHESVSLEAVAAGTSGLELVLSRPGQLVFRVRDARSGADLDPADCDFAWRRAGEAEFRYWGVGLFRQPGLDGWYPDELPAGWLDLRVVRKASDYLPLQLERVWIPAGPEPARIELLLDPGLVVRVQLAQGQEPWPSGHSLLLIEGGHWDDVLDGTEPGQFRALGRMSAFHPHCARFDENGAATIRGLAPGRFRFKVFPPDVLVEPGDVAVGDDGLPPLVVRWRHAP